MSGGHLQTMRTRKRRVSSGELKISAQRETSEVEIQCCHLSSSLPRLASALQLSGMLHEALAAFGDQPTKKRAQKGSQSWGKSSHRQNKSTGITVASEWGGVVYGGKAVVEITHNQVSKAVKPTKSREEKIRNKEGSLFIARNQKLQRTIS